MCEGNPDQCTVVVVGENPATELGVDWWQHWDESRGFLFAEWTAAYEESRRGGGKPAVSPTRLRLDRLRKHGVRCLETNVFFNERLKGPGEGWSNSDLLDFALSSLHGLRFVIAHGRIAQEYLQGKTLPRTVLKVFRTKHFRLESYEAIDRIAHEILSSLEAR